MSLIEKLKSLYQEMITRKQVLDLGDLDFWLKVQHKLPADLKLVFAVCYYEGEPVAVNVWTNIGNRGILLLRINGNKALELSASYLLVWEQFVNNKESLMSKAFINCYCSFITCELVHLKIINP